MYQWYSSYNGRYIGEPKKRILKCCTEHQQDSITGNWESHDTIEHTTEYHGQFNWVHPIKVAVMPNMYKTKVHEALDISRLKTLNETNKTFKVLNRENGGYFKNKHMETAFQENGKLLNCNFGIKFWISLKTIFSTLSWNVTAC